MNIQDIKKIYFIGIGGIGMSAIARFFLQRGVAVYGYDKTATPLTQTLIDEGAIISFEDNEHAIIEEIDAVVYTPAIPKDNKVWNYYSQSGITLMKRSDILKVITANMRTIAIAGTHGKTTTSTMTAHILKETGIGCNAFLGGVSVNNGTNFWSSDNNIAVVEADEYDRSFLKLFPEIAVLTSMDADHLDIYETEEACQQAFIDFTNNIKPNGHLIVKHGLKRYKELAGLKQTYSLQNDLATTYAQNIVIKDGGYTFDVISKGWMIPKVTLNIGGMHNVENAIAAISVAKLLDLPNDAIIDAVRSFKGIKRRFEYIVKNDKCVYIDDYAHHPEELKSLIRSAKTLFPKKKMTLIFQPHLYSRTRDFADGFAEVISLADEIILLDIYPARELPMEGVTSEMIKEKMGNPNVTILSKESALAFVQASPIEMLITAGAGDIDTLIHSLKNIIESK